MASVKYRKRGDRWHIRLRASDKPELTESLPGTLSESYIIKRTHWWDEQISRGREDPWKDPEMNPGLKQNTLEHSYRLAELIDKWCKDNLASENWSQRTYDTNKDRLQRNMAGLLQKKLSGLSQPDFQDALESAPGNSITRKGVKTVMNTFLKWLAKQQYVPLWKVDLPVADKINNRRNGHSIKYLTWQQLTDICSAHRWEKRQFVRLKYMQEYDVDFWPDVWWFMFWQMLRREELPRICKKDVLEGCTKIRVYGKGRRVDIIPIVPPARKIAQKYYARLIHPDQHLFTGSSNRLYKQFNMACRLALGQEADKGLHQLRHGGAVHYFTLGKKVQFVSKLLRHASVQVTFEVYGDVIPEGVEQAFADVINEPAT